LKAVRMALYVALLSRLARWCVPFAPHCGCSAVVCLCV
jgi:hypothetical protein